MQVLTAVLPKDVMLCQPVNSDVSKGCNASIFRYEPKKKWLQLLDAEDEISTILRSSVTTNRHGVKSHKTLIFSVNVHYCLHKTTLFDPVRSRMNPASCLHYTGISSTLILFSRLCQYLPSIFCLSSFTSITAYVLFPCAMTCLCHIPWFRHCDGVWRSSNVRSLFVHFPVPVPGPVFSATQFFL